MFHKRDITVDILRGLAIFTMVAANLAALVLVEPHPFWLRYYGSLAAPLFILISGMMVAFTTQTKGYGLKHFLVRGVLIVSVGALVDLLIWKIYPFISFDVLYLIGFSLPLAYLFLRLNAPSRWLIVIFIFLATPVLQKVLGYTPYPTEIEIYHRFEPAFTPGKEMNVFHHWVIDGWFPLFPWLGFSFLGVNLGESRWKYGWLANLGKKSVFLAGIIILALGSIIRWFYPGSLLVRDGYSELFYPPTLGYVISTIGLIFLLFSIVDWRPSLIIYKPLQFLGGAALFMYVLHLSAIEYVIAPVWADENLPKFLIIYIVLSVILILTAYGLRLLKNRWGNRPFIIRFLLGR